MEQRGKEIRLLFDAPPGRDMPTLIGAEDEKGRTVGLEEWRQRPDGYWELVLPAAPPELG